MSHIEPSFPTARVKPLYGGGNFDGYAPVVKARLWDGRPVWLITRYADVQRLLRDHETFSRKPGPQYPAISPGRAATLGKEAPSFMRMDPPEHTHFQRMIAPEFTIKRIQAWKPRMEQIVDGILDEFERKGPPADIYRDLGLSMPTTVIAEMLGIPTEDHAYINQRSQYRFNNDVDAETARKALAELTAYVDQQFARRENGEDTDDIIGRYVKNYVKPGHVGRAQAIQTIEVLVATGHETTANMIAMGTLLFLSYPDQAQLLRQEPNLISSAVNELLRYLTVNQAVGAAVCRKDTVIGGQQITAGEGVIALLPAANTDASVFSEPDKLDIRRNPVQHLAFGSGVHRCLGQNLAKLELEVIFSKLLNRFPGLRLGVPYEALEFKHGNMVFGVKRLPLEW